MNSEYRTSCLKVSKYLRFFSLSCWAIQIATKAKKMQSFIFILLDFSPCLQNQDWWFSKSERIHRVSENLWPLFAPAKNGEDPDDHITSALNTSGHNQTEAHLENV